MKVSKIAVLAKWQKCLFVLILPNLWYFGINMPFAVHWNPHEAK